MVLSATACRDRDPDPDAGGRRDAGPTERDAGDCTPMGAEDTAGACADGMDNDCNGFVDCNDFDCCSVVTCDPSTTCGQRDGGNCTMTGAEDTMAACDDGMDNDCNGFVDCRDFDCSSFCGAENSNPRCVDGEDNDSDGFVDCEDNDCMMRVVCDGEASNATCSDGMDNDMADGADCMDPDCQAEAIVVCNGTTPVAVPADQWAAMVMTRCTNGTDDGGRPEIDCGEFSCLFNFPGCDQPPREGGNTLCNDGMDNDLDGLEDCDDPGCDAEGTVVCDGPAPPPMAMWEALSNTECSNTVDDDMNTHTDCADFGCQSAEVTTACPNSESNDARCDDGMDNDGNGFTDCMDFSCSRNESVTVCANATENTFEECSNGIDDDMDGFVDCGDFSSCNPPSGTRSPACF